MVRSFFRMERRKFTYTTNQRFTHALHMNYDLQSLINGYLLHSKHPVWMPLTLD